MPAGVPRFRHAYLDAHDRGDARPGGCLEEPRDAVEAVPVGEGERLHAQLCGGGGELGGGSDPEPVGEAAPTWKVGEALAKALAVAARQSTTPMSSHSPEASRARGPRPPLPASRTRKTSRSTLSSASHQDPTSRQRSSTRTTRLLRALAAPSRSVSPGTPGRRPGGARARAPRGDERSWPLPPGSPTPGEPGALARCSAMVLLDSAVAKSGSSKPGGRTG